MTHRLPKHIIPVNYTIRIEPIAPLYNKFIGKCVIVFKILDPNINYIILNGLQLKITNVKMASITNNNIIYHKHISTEHLNEYEQIKFNFESMPSKLGALIIEYEGSILENLSGLYKCTQNDKLIMLTQFEPASARACFPCFDEPCFKAVFKLEIIVSPDKLVLSNTDVESITQHNNDKLYTFKPTPKMSSYLLAFYIGYADYIENYTKHNVRVRIYSPKEKQYSKLALDVAIKCMDVLTDYFDMPYPLNKIDLVSVPVFSAEAMENWGLVIFREDRLICEPLMKINDKIYIIIVICHELAHQWFGNLVTMEWWSDLWLNESFATWAEYYIIEKLYPELNINNKFMYDRYIHALKADSIETTHPINVNVNNPAQISEIFDTITYSKGASIIKMLVAYVGENDFRNSMRLYMKQYAYQNTVAEDLWRCISFITKKDISTMMNSWINKQNYPLVIVDLYDETHFKFTQTIFTFQQHKEGNLWIIPLGHNTILSKKETILLKSEFKTKIDNNDFGFYNIFYCAPVFNDLIQNIKMTDLDITNLLVDLYFLLKSNRITPNYYFEYINKILKVSIPSELLYNIVQMNYNNFRLIIQNDKLIEKYKQIIIDNIKNINFIILHDDDINIILMKLSVLNLGVKLNIKTHVDYCINIFNKFYDAYQNKKDYINIIDVNIIDIVFYVGMNKLDKFDFLIELLHSNKDYETQIISCLGQTKNKTQYTMYLDLFKLGTISNINKTEIFNVAGANKQYNYLLWPYIKDNWDLIVNTFEYFNKLDKIILSMKNLLGNNILVDDINLFFKMKKKDNAYKKLLEIIKINNEFNNKLK